MVREAFCDLHIHTNYSDGEYPPREVVRRAARAGLSVIAITDHDNILGIDEAIEEGEAIGISVLPGVELSAEDNGNDIHILGYLFDHRNGQLKETLEFFRAERLKRAKTILEKLRELGVFLDIEEVLEEAGHGAVGRPHIAHVLIKKGYVATVREAFESYLGYESPAYVPKFKMTVKDAIDLIKKAGGIPVIAHPGISAPPHKVLEFIDLGLLGIEVWHPEHDEDTIAFYSRVADEHGLVKTGGSDYHGEQKGRANLGTIKLPYAVVRDLLALKERLRVS